MIDWDKRFPMLSLTRKHLKDAGIAAEHIALLTDEDMQKIATHAASLYLECGDFVDDIKFAAWNLILGTKLDNTAHERQSSENDMTQRHEQLPEKRQT